MKPIARHSTTVIGVSKAALLLEDVLTDLLTLLTATIATQTKADVIVYPSAITAHLLEDANQQMKNV